jgi:RNA polymerase sigma-70 factor, ECF subfamily
VSPTPGSEYVPGPAEARWVELVSRIRSGEPSALTELYEVFSAGVRFQLYRQLGEQEFEDRLHDLFLMIARSIRDGDVREPQRLMGYIRAVVRRQTAEFIKDAIGERQMQMNAEDGLSAPSHEPDPERRAIELQHRDLARRVLNGVGKRDREVLTRFYLREQPVEEICREMELSETQFRLIKSRAKSRFGELCRSRLGLKKVFRH